MKSVLFSLLLISVLLPGQRSDCTSEVSQHGIISRPDGYFVGDTLSIEDQVAEYEICFGNYPNDFFKFADVNYLLNGGTPYVTMLRVNASW